MKRLFLFVFALFAFVACTQETIDEVSAVREDAAETITVGFEDDATRIQLNEALKTVWTKDDLVTVFYRSNANQKWQYQGETGERQGTLKRVESVMGSVQTTKTVVVYPYSENYWLNTDSYCIDAVLPATQYYAEGSYGVGSNLMVSQSEFTQFSLKSVCGWLKLQLTGNGEVVKSIKFRGNNGEQVAGLIYVDTATAESTLASEMGDNEDNNAGGNLFFEDTILTEVTLDCGAGVELGAEATSFYIALPPQTFEKGLTVEIKDEKDWVMTKSTTNALAIERNYIQPMASFEVDIKPVLSEYYITTEFEIDTPDKSLNFVNNLSGIVNEGNALVNIDYGDGSFGKTVPHTYEERGRYTVKFYFEQPITEILDNAFIYSHIRSVEIPATVTRLGYKAFYLSSLEKITFEKNSQLKTIGGMAFSFCRDLEGISLPSSVDYIGECVFGGCINLKTINIYSSKYLSGYIGLDEAIALYEINSVDKIIAYTAGHPTEVLSGRYLSLDIGWGAFTECQYIKTVNLINITNIEQCNFRYCNNLESINLVCTATIANDVLSYCDKLEGINAPDAISIGGNTFCNNMSMTYINLGSDELVEINGIGNNNDNLQSVRIPAGVTQITNSFNNNPMLNEMYCKATTPPALTNSFNGADAPRIYVPVESLSEYMNAEGWGDYADAIVAYDFENNTICNPKEAVDLGLSVKWASFNVGANSPEEYGDYFAWGEVSPKVSYYEDNCSTYGVAMSDISGNPQYDAATANWGGAWRMPTKSEQQELLNNCTWEWTTLNGVNGRKVTGPNGNSIFLPATGVRYGTSSYDVGSNGFYWSSTPSEDDGYGAYFLYFGSDDYDWHWGHRDYGQSVRPVSE